MIRNTYGWKKFFSLVGVLPLGFFVVLHFFTNNYSNFGPEVYDAKLAASRDWPFYNVLVIVGIYLPLFFHAIYGLFLAGKTAKAWNNTAWPYFNNLKYSLQRLSGVGLLLFLPAHLVKSKILPAWEGTPADFALMNEGMSDPVTLAVYCLGVLGVSFHLANGLWSWTVTWGICVSERSQKLMQTISFVLFVAFVLLGMNAIRGLSDLF